MRIKCPKCELKDLFLEPFVYLAEENAYDFLSRSEDDFERRSLKYTPHEQRKEAREKYEEKCTRSFISRKMSKPRWCPKLSE